jgi:hypothetical protein
MALLQKDSSLDFFYHRKYKKTCQLAGFFMSMQKHRLQQQLQMLLAELRSCA